MALKNIYSLSRRPEFFLGCFFLLCLIFINSVSSKPQPKISIKTTNLDKAVRIARRNSLLDINIDTDIEDIDDGGTEFGRKLGETE